MPPDQALPDAIAAWRARPRGDRVACIERTPDEVRALIAGCSEDELRGSSPAEGWRAVEVISHMRDIEEFNLVRFRMILRMIDPSVPAAGAPEDPLAWGLIEDGAWLFDPERWATDRQYRRDDPHESAEAFARLRAQSLAFLERLSDAQWGRGSIHPRFGRLTIEDWTAVLAWHDENHIAQLSRILSHAEG